ncbi:MAG: 2-octaprenyl-6-methoxyphenyl hydroxylase [Pseudomonadota bacterium]
MTCDADVLVVGGGLVGQSLCAALEGLPLRAVQVECDPPRAGDAARWDERNFALAHRSVLALDRWGVWPHAAAEARPIVEVHASSRGDFGAVRISAADCGVDSLGHTVPARAIGVALAARLAGCRTVERTAPARLSALAFDESGVTATLDTPSGSRALRVRLVVGADGTASAVRGFAGIGAETRDYGQTAIVCTIATRGAPPGRAFERFTDSGPFALLPLSDDRLGLVWTVPAVDAETALALDDDAFIAAAQVRFGRRAGTFLRVGRRQTWPLRLTRALRVVGERVVLVGNAAQTIHPIGAQGFNLGLRDVEALAALLAEAAAGGADPGNAARLAALAAAREADRSATIRISDGLARAFLPTALPLRLLRGAALAALDRAPPLKRALAWALMGWRAAGTAQ